MPLLLFFLEVRPITVPISLVKALGVEFDEDKDYPSDRVLLDEWLLFYNSSNFSIFNGLIISGTCALIYE